MNKSCKLWNCFTKCHTKHRSLFIQRNQRILNYALHHWSVLVLWQPADTRVFVYVRVVHIHMLTSTQHKHHHADRQTDTDSQVYKNWLVVTEQAAKRV